MKNKLAISYMASCSLLFAYPVSANTVAELSCSGDIWTFGGMGSSNDATPYFDTVTVKNKALHVPGIGDYSSGNYKDPTFYWRTQDNQYPKKDWAYFNTDTGKFVASLKDGYFTKQLHGTCGIKSGSLHTMFD